MPHHATRPTAQRNAENELYDLGCDLVEAAAGIALRAADPCAARAVPALLGCIEAALKELSGACGALKYSTAESSASAENARGRAVANRLERGYANLIVSLEDARYASRAVRPLAARYTAERGDHGCRAA
jgi:cob(I)alamin adenosyltransferase